MSFSNEVKNELARIEIEKKCCMLSEISGFLRVSGSLRLAGGGKFKIVVTTDNPAVARHYKKLIKAYFQVDTELEIGEGTSFKKGYSYKLTINPDRRSEQILRETGILLVREGNNYISDGIYGDIIRSKCCRKAYLRGMFMAGGSVTDPEKAYHLEISCNSNQLAKDLKKLINSFDDLSAKIIQRKKTYGIYMKSGVYVRDTLAIMGAHNKVLEFDEIMIKKEMLSETVRITNCDNANTDRALDASRKQIDAILLIDKSKGIDALPDKLKDIARLRMENPEASLSQLGEMMSPPLKKSGVNNRFRKIMEIAKQL